MYMAADQNWGRVESYSDFKCSMNEELVASAVSFLRDPNVSTSPLDKKIEFLQSKGLNQEEIEEAMKRANAPTSGAPVALASPSTLTSPVTSYHNVQNVPPLDYYPLAPAVPERTWKDYFIMATATAGVTYGLYQVVSRYLIPSIIPPGQSRINEDKEKIEEEFVKIDKVLEQMALEQKEIKDANEAKLKDIEVVIENVNDFLSKYNKDKLKFDDDLRLMKLEVDSLQNTLEKNLNLTKENIHDELSDVCDELKSLKNLIKARSSEALGAERKVTSVSSIPSASEILRKAKQGTSNDSSNTKSASPVEVPAENGKTETSAAPQVASNVFAAGIPDWQLKHKQQEEENEKQSKMAGIPAWQQAMKDSRQAEDDVVKESIDAVGVPAWQLNSK